VYRTFIILLPLLYLSAFQDASSRQQPPLPRPPMTQPGVPNDESGPNIPPQVQKDMEKRANEQRQAELKRDTDRLFKLSTELKDYVDKTNSNVLSLEVIKKAEEIEKLAHSVRTKMRGNN
jgi:hypothetical protein